MHIKNVLKVICLGLYIFARPAQRGLDTGHHRTTRLVYKPRPRATDCGRAGSGLF